MGFLVNSRADVDARTRLGDTALHIAQRLGFQETVLALSTSGASLRSGTPSRRSRSESPAPDKKVLVSGAGTSSAEFKGDRAGYPPKPRSGTDENGGRGRGSRG